MRLNNEPHSFSLAPYQGKPAGPVCLTATERAAQLSQAGRAFEGFMLGELLKVMRNAEGESRGVIPVGRAERIFVNQQCEALGEALAQTEPLGLARMLVAQAGLPMESNPATMQSLRRPGGPHAPDTH